MICYSCSSDEPEYHKVTVEATVSNGATAWIKGVGEDDSRGVCFQNQIKGSYETKDLYQVQMTCDDPKALLTVKIWIDKKLTDNIIGNSYINTGIKNVNDLRGWSCRKFLE